MGGKDTYDERRRVQAENDLLREQRENERLKLEVASEGIAVLFTDVARAILSGTGAILVIPALGGGFRITVEAKL